VAPRKYFSRPRRFACQSSGGVRLRALAPSSRRSPLFARQLIAATIIWKIDNQRMFQLVAAVSILAAGMTLLIPILHRLGKTDPTAPPPLTIFDEKNIAVLDGEILQLKKRIAELEKLRDEIARSG
jgi:hypothetical protein